MSSSLPGSPPISQHPPSSIASCPVASTVGPQGDGNGLQELISVLQNVVAPYRQASDIIEQFSHQFQIATVHQLQNNFSAHTSTETGTEHHILVKQEFVSKHTMKAVALVTLADIGLGQRKLKLSHQAWKLKVF